MDGAGPGVRAGIGYDVHPLVPGRSLVLGGVTVPFDRGLDGHSDADVLAHAVADALLGASGQGDLGRHFPPGDPRFAGASSLTLLYQVARLARSAGFEPVYVDATVICQAPRLGPHLPAMGRALAGALDVPPTAVNLKATTHEGLGALGRGEGIAALAVVTVQARANRV